jgi:hypothetical protein
MQLPMTIHAEQSMNQATTRLILRTFRVIPAAAMQIGLTLKAELMSV